MGDTQAEKVGLCAHCRHARTVRTDRAIYWLCELSFSDPRFPKYPRLPVVACTGFVPKDPAPEDPSAG